MAAEHDGVLVVLSRSVVADDIVALELGSASGRPLPPWEPGAHVDVLLPNGMVRSYALCGSSEETWSWRIAVLRESFGRGGSKWVHEHARVGLELRFRGPHNGFRLRSARRYLFVGGGIGIAPLLPMLAHVDAKGADWALLYTGRNRSAMAFLPELLCYRERVVVWSQDRYGPPGLAGFLGDPAPSALVYCSGPESLTAAVRENCVPWPSDALSVERFTVLPSGACSDVVEGDP